MTLDEIAAEISRIELMMEKRIEEKRLFSVQEMRTVAMYLERLSDELRAYAGGNRANSVVPIRGPRLAVDNTKDN